MKFLHKYGTRSIEVRRARRELYFRLSLVLAVLLFFAAMIAIAKLRPNLEQEEIDRLPETANIGDPMTNPELVLMRAEVADLMADFQNNSRNDSIDLEELEQLELAIDKQRDIIRMRGSEIAPKADVDRLENLLTMYDENMGQFLIAQSLLLEEKAEQQMEARQYKEAIDSLTRSRNLQEEINEMYPRASTKDSTRLHRLNNRLLTWETRPLADTADRLREKAYELVERGEYAEARETIEEALQKQQQLNEDHRDSRFATVARLRQMETAWKEIQVAEDADRVDELVQQSRIALGAGQDEIAFLRAQEAEVLQRRVIDRFAQKNSSRNQLLAEIRELKDTAESQPAYLRIEELRREVRETLRSRQMDNFKNSVSEWLRSTRDFKTSYPNSRYTDEINDAEVIFLHERREEIPTLLESIYRNLIAVPGQGRKYLYRTEIPQALYVRLIGENPSNIQDPQHPVDSLTWLEAREFAEKMGWILALPVSLPSRELFRSAMGNLENTDLQEYAWSSRNTDRTTQPVGTSDPNDLGFYDLLGNVSEWIAASTDEPQDRVLAVGGSVRDTDIRLSTVPEESRAPTERNRFVGFRVEVSMGEE